MEIILEIFDIFRVVFKINKDKHWLELFRSIRAIYSTHPRNNVYVLFSQLRLGHNILTSRTF